ncbi:hypothetical protein NM092_003627 [Vibrio cholerae]|uniref:hypothetical protein n=1 Tax=Vibrio cholerae TaxID=666 RepID=UPI00155F2557|nr:hypothetical protein [Vibrio cholerae]EGR4280556.1 hypothetical protein [Vibrio cholerae]EIF2259454.1 hypothetical protein [Vibrio cholerae]EJL6336267.1 hypothetical protein [Vibrio cholerae]EJL6337297.1 hypothetical protein [Vibrio cholerae]EJL6666508.1 hypothetical protein [Vibrio cholerae]
MRPIPFVLFTCLIASQTVLAETAIDSTKTLDPTICTDNTQILERLQQTTDFLSTATALLTSCPDNALQIASLATSINPQLTREIYAALFKQTPNEQLIQQTVDAVRSIDQERRADVVQAAIESAPQELAQAIVDAVAEAGLMDPTEIIIAAIAGGADPGSITEPTAAGIATPPPIALAPGLTNTFGTGNGNGGGTASPN